MIQYLLNKYKHNNTWGDGIMDFQSNENNNEDQDLASALAGIMHEDDSDETNSDDTQTIQVENGDENLDEVSNNVQAPVEVAVSNNDVDLESIKKQALIELKPLIEKIELTPEERFDLYLLMLRVTDDAKLIDPAHKTALNISDEVKRAQALLDIIKEIDYLSSPHPVSL